MIAPRLGHAQTFELDLNNLSDVSQTVLGLTNGKYLADRSLTGEPETLTVSTSRLFPVTGAPVAYTSKPVTIPPRGQYRLRLTEVTERSLWSCGRSEYFSSLSLQVRVGIVTRTETLDFGGLILEIRSPAC